MVFRITVTKCITTYNFRSTAQSWIVLFFMFVIIRSDFYRKNKRKPDE